ncbi:MAG: hypothetical protein JO292_06910 [Betaproteobacteria bacterium]|nr:hypothetical protein [Betaproteobacteria bacterium]MBV9361105.1 hypothetical protein [Betaproteobacteria bacterium]
MRFLGLLLAVLSTTVLAAPFAVQVGETRLALDTPSGFAAVQATGSPRLLELGEQLTSATNKILLFALEDADVRRFTVGDSPELRRYAIIVTPRDLQTARVTAAGFRSLVTDAMRDLGSPPDPKLALRTYLDAEPRRPKLIAELRKEQDVVSIMQGARLPDPPRSKAEPRYLLNSMTFMLVRGKALNLALYTLQNGPDDVEWLRAATLRWIEELQQLNLR